MTTATQHCTPTPLLKATISSRLGEWAMPDRAAHCGEETDRFVHGAGWASFDALLRSFLLGLTETFLSWSAEGLTVRWDRGSAHFETELWDSGGGTALQISLTPTTLDMPARAALLAVLGARNAAIEGDHLAVDTFARDILGIARPELCRDGVITALLGDWVHHLGSYLTDPELLRILNEYTAAERRRWQPLWERRANGGRVWLTGATIADGITLDDVLPDHRTTEDLALHHQLDDERLRAVLRGLTADEAAVAARWAQGAGTWVESALSADLPAAYGERVRRKLHRLGARQTQRAAAVAR
ncbi:hypothetical protein ACFWVP_19705 [Streptomyces sp. NPDC058637]|uniref:hypothetical protein n=1 Tax=Streptomyces sp. NPDC058637 TaxID=3346569 RepID=UPI00365F760D